jgi:hypothetical protein
MFGTDFRDAEWEEKKTLRDLDFGDDFDVKAVFSSSMDRISLDFCRSSSESALVE